MAETGGASLRTFERLFLDETNLSLAAWRRQSRLLTSLSLLAEGKSIGEVADAVGYDSAAAFGTAFKQCFGVTPSGYMAGEEKHLRRAGMAIKGIFYVFALVSDMARSKKFYGEALGWKLGTDENDVAGFAFGSGYLVIHADRNQVSRTSQAACTWNCRSTMSTPSTRGFKNWVSRSASCRTSPGVNGIFISPIRTGTPGFMARPHTQHQ